MSFFLGGGGHTSHGIKFFDIRLDSPYIVFRGSESEAASAHLRGRVVLCLTDILTIKHLKLTLNGISRVSWYLPSASSVGGSRRVFKERAFFEHTWTFRDPGKSKTETLQPDNYEYPFELVLEGSLPESVEGLHDNWVIYRLKAEIGRKYAKDVVVRKPLRIIRTLDPSNNLELSHAMAVENIWPNKIEYSISTPSKAVIFGTAIRIDFRLVPLLKGLRMGQITTKMVESHDFVLDPDLVATTSNNYKHTKIIASDEWMLDENTEPDVLDEEVEGYQFSRHIELPKSLKNCLQDTETRGIKVRHKLKFTVQLLNPDGHVSELRATIPVALFISPSMAINDNNDLVDQSPASAQQAIDELQHNAPPMYGEHHFDQLYSEVDLNGYRTPGNLSTPGTPGLGCHSRSGSHENLASLNAIANGGDSNDVSATALAHRLHSLRVSQAQISGRSSDHGSGDYFGNGDRSGEQSGSHSRQSPGNLSRRASEEDQTSSSSGAHTPMVHFQEIETMSRVPSYTTAVRSTARTAISGDLPSYQAATSGPPSGSSTPGLAAPGAAHIRPARGRRFSGDIFGVRPATRFALPNDEERRLRLLQARARG